MEKQYLKDNIEKKSFQVVRDAYIFGTGHTARLYANGLSRAKKINIKGYCVSAPETSHFGEKELFAIDDVVKQDQYPLILVCTWQKEVYEYVKVRYGEFAEIVNLDKAIFGTYKTDVINVCNMLTDEWSKEIYSNLIVSRIELEMPNEKYTHGESYFSIPEARRYGNETFVDCGAYVGDTIEQYLWKKPSFNRIIAFEPDTFNFQALKKRVDRMREEWNLSEDKIVLINAGVGKQTTELYLESGNAIGSLISSEGLEKCKIVCLDDFIVDRVDFIAADVEGFEYDLVIGAATIIKTYKPLIAISIYHNAMDMFQIPLLLKQYVPEYCFAIRHNTVTYDDTILYAYLPNSVGWLQ